MRYIGEILALVWQGAICGATQSGMGGLVGPVADGAASRGVVRRGSLGLDWRGGALWRRGG
jgi:hypothetical protein